MDPVLFWNAVALEENRYDHSQLSQEQGGPCLSARALGLVHLAIYDAFAATSGGVGAGFTPFLPGLPAPAAGSSVDAAVAGAAHTMLSTLYPRRRSSLDATLASLGLGADAPVSDGRAFGTLVAERLLAEHPDPGVGDGGYTYSPLRGRHRTDPNNPGQRAHAPFYGARSRCFAVTARHELSPPPSIGSPTYEAALREVRSKGIAPELAASIREAERRTPEETLIGIFWAYDGAKEIGTPPRLYNQIVRKLAILRGNTPAQNARLFALINVAMADAGILAWDQKYVHDFWRPVVGVREHASSMGPLGTGGPDIGADCDPGWLPLGSPKTNEEGKKNFTPSFPAYPSGHATFGAAAFHAARLFYGASHLGPDDLLRNLTFVSDELNGESFEVDGAVRPRHARTFPGGLWQALIENARSRVYLGVHWLFDGFAVDASGTPDLTQDIGGVWLGVRVATDIYTSGMVQSSVGPRT